MKRYIVKIKRITIEEEESEVYANNKRDAENFARNYQYDYNHYESLDNKVISEKTETLSIEQQELTGDY